MVTITLGHHVLQVSRGLCTGLLLIFLYGCISIEVTEKPREPKRNILFYIGADSNGIDNGSAGDEPKAQLNVIRAGWIPGKGELLIFADQTNHPPCLMRINNIKGADGLYGIDTVHVYNEENSADAAVLGRIIDTVVVLYPADSYGMIFFSHASGWLPEGMLAHPRSLVIDKGDGTAREMTYQAFAAAIPDKRFDFLIFEACFMADVMTMYELRNKAEYILASSAEIVSPGFLYIYKNEIMRLFDTGNPIPTIISGFGQAYVDCIKREFPENNVFCSTTLGVIKMNEMDNLASTVKASLNGIKITESTLTVDSIQRFDRPAYNRLNLIISGQRKSRYFDFGHVIENLVSDAQYTLFHTQLQKTVVWKANTRRFLLGDDSGVPNYEEYDGFLIKHHSGLTTYIQQSGYYELNTAYENSSWYKAIYE